MRLIPGTAVACLALALCASGAEAAPNKSKAKPKPPPPPACNLVTDVSGDTGGGAATQVGPKQISSAPDPNLDILSADIATSTTSLTAVWRLGGTEFTTDLASPAGHEYELSFTVGSTNYTVAAVIWPAHTYTKSAPNPFAAGSGSIVTVNMTPGYEWSHGGSGSIDTSKKEIRVTVRLDQLNRNAPDTLQAGATFTNLSAKANQWAGISKTPQGGGTSVGLVDAAPDSGNSPKTYVGGSPSCITVG